MSAKADRAIAYQLIRDAHRRPSFIWPILSALFCAWRELRPGGFRAKCEMLPAAGDCLRPWIQNGDLLAYSRDLEARPGDLVVHSTPVEIRAGLGTPGRTVTLLGAKMLQIDRNGWRWLSSADGSYKADPDHTILGPIVIIARKPGWPWRRRAPLRDLNFPIRPAPSDDSRQVVRFG